MQNLKNKIQEYDNNMLNDENEQLNGSYDNNDDDFYENYQQEALNKNVIIVIYNINI